MSENNTLSKGQIALQQARRRGFNVKELPEALKKEITEFHDIGPVSYTHLTLPTNREV